jgi:hypothetical protein
MSVYSWIDYYEASSFLARVDRRGRPEWADAELASRLGVELEELVHSELGTCWVEVASPNLARDRTWFAHGDPWTVLLGLGGSDVVVGRPWMTETAMAGPHRLEAHHTTSPIAHRRGHVSARLLEAVSAAQRSVRRGLWTCPLCQSKRYQSGCRCFAMDTGICLD